MVLSILRVILWVPATAILLYRVKKWKIFIFSIGFLCQLVNSIYHLILKFYILPHVVKNNKGILRSCPEKKSL